MPQGFNRISWRRRTNSNIISVGSRSSASLLIMKTPKGWMSRYKPLGKWQKNFGLLHYANGRVMVPKEEGSDEVKSRIKGRRRIVLNGLKWAMKRWTEANKSALKNVNVMAQKELNKLTLRAGA